MCPSSSTVVQSYHAKQVTSTGNCRHLDGNIKEGARTLGRSRALMTLQRVLRWVLMVGINAVFHRDSEMSRYKNMW